MERKTKVHAEDGKQDILITREFELPVELLFKAYTNPDIITQWMGTKVLKLESRRHGGYEFETADPQGNILFKAHGTIHDLIPGKKIIRTFEMANAGFDAQIEFLEFESLMPGTSKLTIQMIFRSPELRDAQLKLPFAYGINMAHDRLQQIANQLK
ncbi:MAG: SRPBCC domain-containing protein [Chitinophagaceae bacterium]|nr:SRPBCC domain-containing protein [Chitinophagaceae bacterium]